MCHFWRNWKVKTFVSVRIPECYALRYDSTVLACQDGREKVPWISPCLIVSTSLRYSFCPGLLRDGRLVNDVASVQVSGIQLFPELSLAADTLQYPYRLGHTFSTFPSGRRTSCSPAGLSLNGTSKKLPGLLWAFPVTCPFMWQ